MQTIEKEAKKEVEDALAKAKVCTITLDVCPGVVVLHVCCMVLEADRKTYSFLYV